MNKMRGMHIAAATMLALGGAMADTYPGEDRRRAAPAGKPPCPDREDRRAKAKAQRKARRKQR